MRTTSKNSPNFGLRIGVDFGPGHTGIALLDSRNRVLDREVIAHRPDLSNALKSRREFRAMRRRAKSRKSRLREFRALLTEMGIPPDPNRPREFVGNALYALAHRRGWDYSTLEELLADESGDTPRETDIVRRADDFLKERVPVCRLEKLDGATTRVEDRRKREEAAQMLESGKRPPDDLLRHVKLRQTCLGEFAKLLRAARDAEIGGDDEDAAQKREAAERVRETLRKPERIPEWLDQRLDIVFGGEAPADERDNARRHILALLGYANPRAVFEAGDDYRPHNRQHRDKALDELRKLLTANGMEKWMPRARAILNRQYRKKRFKNRAPGKCVVCGLNLPLRVKVRRLLFDIEILQIRLVDKQGDGEIRNLHPDEIAELKSLVNFHRGKIRDREKWRNFFRDRFPPPQKKPEDDGGEEQTKPAQLRAIAEGVLEGRVSRLCRKCLMKKAELLKTSENLRDAEWKSRWRALSGERVLGLQDAAPSLRQKVERVCGRIRRMLENARKQHPELRDAPLQSIGVERAAFDIVAASSVSGRRPQKSQYGRRRPRGPAELLRDQGGLCIYCGKPPGADLTVDHFIPRAVRGGDAHKNRLAACMACNLQKNNLGGIQFAAAALGALRESDPDKAAHLEKNADKLVADNLSAPQQTMLGVKILRGELAKVFFGDPACATDKEKFPVIRARDAAALRTLWFPRIARIKQALRAADPDRAVVIHPGDRPKKQRGVLAQGENPPEFIRRESDVIVIAPLEQRDHEGVFGLLLEESRQWSVSAGKPVRVDLKRENIRGRLVRVNGCPPADSGLPVRWEIRDRILTLTACRTVSVRLTFAFRVRIVVPPKKGDPAEKYHHAADAMVVAANKRWDQIIRLAREPDKRSARAAKLLNSAGRPAGPLADDNIPPHDSDLWLFKDERDKSGSKRQRLKANPIRRAPPHRVPQGGETKKTADKAEFTQRIPLDKLGRDKISKIPESAGAIREALRRAWREIDDASPEERKLFAVKLPGNDEAIAAEWFLKKQREAWAEINALPPAERALFVRIPKGQKREVIRGEWFRADPEKRTFLHPNRVRSVPVKVDPGAPFALPPEGRGGHVHLFWCEPPLWSEVAVWREKRDKNGGAKSKSVRVSRRRAPFYRSGSPFPHKRQPTGQPRDLPEWENGPPPPDAFRLRPGMNIRVQNESGLWRVAGLEDKRAQLLPADRQARSFAESAAQNAKPENLLWRGQLVRRSDKYQPDGKDRPARDIPGTWRVDNLDEQTGLSPQDQDARHAARNGAPDSAPCQRLRPRDQTKPPVGEKARRIGNTAPPGIWRIQQAVAGGKFAVIPADLGARRAARNRKKREHYSRLIPSGE